MKEFNEFNKVGIVMNCFRNFELINSKMDKVKVVATRRSKKFKS